jgi:hypothetical protein
MTATPLLPPLVTTRPTFTDAGRLALAGFLAQHGS